MSIFRYDSRHKITLGIIVILASAAAFYLRDHEKPSFDNGQSKQVGSQMDGRNHGQWIWYHPNGNKKMQGTFNRGKREGLWLTFSPKGDTLTKAIYADDKLNGPYAAYGPDGKVLSVTSFSNDNVITRR